LLDRGDATCTSCVGSAEADCSIGLFPTNEFVHPVLTAIAASAINDKGSFKGEFMGF